MSAPAHERLSKLPSQTVRPLRGVDRAELRAWAEAHGQRLVEVELQGCADKAAVLRSLATAFEFPEWFGMNLDALYDALTDLPDRAPAGGYVVLLEGLPRTEQFDSVQRDKLLDVFRDAASSFTEHKLPFRVLYT
jgi:RNAse (barnase) inhibitor barstar